MLPPRLSLKAACVGLPGMAVGGPGPPPLVFRLHGGAPELVREVLLERGWEEYEREQEEGDWNLYWRASPFHTSDYDNLRTWQRLNHHPGTVGITRKDCLARNLRRMRGTFGPLYDFSPTAFILPNDYTKFLSEYSKHRMTNGGRRGYWICKPVDLSRGRGIFIFNDIKDLVYDSPVIIQSYISNPLLISGYKFDLRIYVCVKSFQPLTIYMYQEGLVRFATEKYNLSSLDNLYSHLTNTSINKFGPFYTTDKERVGQGCKWTMSKFRCYLHSQGVNELILWQKINSIVTLTLLTIAPSIPPSPNCVELFGFDILIDAKFKPWLLEVNFSPSLSLDCQTDVDVKKGLINDLVDLMSYKSMDGVRQCGYLRLRYKRPCYLGSQAPQAPVLQARSRPRARAAGCEHHSHNQKRRYSQSGLRSLPLPSDVEMNRTCAARDAISHTSNSSSSSFSSSSSSSRLNLIQVLQQSKTAAVTRNGRTRPQAVAMSHMNVARRKSEVSDADLESGMEDRGVESGMEDRGVESGTGDRGAESGMEDRQVSVSRLPVGGACRLPAIHVQKNRTPKFPSDSKTQEKSSSTPLLRVGDFILTFPFNQATLKASRDELNVKTAVREVRKLIGQLGSGGNQERRRKEGDEVMDRCVEGEKEDFGSLFWGPKNPPLLSECCYSS